MVSLKDLLKKLRKYEIRIRKAVNTQMHGDFHSVFKGSGLEFDDVRSYQYGDDVRTINWTASAKGHDTYVNTFKEEKEQTVFFILDVSASQDIGKDNVKKIDIAKEICSVLLLSAIKEDNSVGVLCYSDQKEKYIRSDKGIQHAYNIITTIFKLQPLSRKTDLNQSILSTLGILKKRSVVILISDFIDTNYDNSLKALARKHDLVVIHLSDRRETILPRLGIIPIFDKENNKTVWVNTSSNKFRIQIGSQFKQNKVQLEDICKKNKASYIQIFTHEDFVPKMVRLFSIRKK